jgi:hypothetical protein
MSQKFKQFFFSPTKGFSEGSPCFFALQSIYWYSIYVAFITSPPNC